MAAQAPPISPYSPFRSASVRYLKDLYASRGLYDIDLFDPEVLADLLMEAEIDAEESNAHNTATFQAFEDSLAAAQATIQALMDAAASSHAPSSSTDAVHAEPSVPLPLTMVTAPTVPVPVPPTSAEAKSGISAANLGFNR